MEFVNLKIDKVDGVVWTTVNRPNKLNALNVETIKELASLVAEIEEDDDVLALVITGSGDKAFVAGADVGELKELSPGEAKEFALRGQRLLSRIERMTKPTIAAVNGFALGGGCELAMACHLRIASANAVFGQPEVKLGLIPGYAGTQRLARIVGRGRALELLMTGRNIPAEEAERIGLVNRVVDQVELTQAVNEVLAVILKNGPLAVTHCIEAVNHGLDMSFDDGCLLEATLFGLCAASEQMREGTSAFLEKRAANFRASGGGDE